VAQLDLFADCEHSYHIQNREGEVVSPNRFNMSYGFWYLVSPYTKYPKGLQAASDLIAKIQADLMRDTICVMSPIPGSHAVASMSSVAGDYETWRQLDESLIESDSCNGIIVATMEGWDISFGVGEELAFADSIGKPIFFLDVSRWEF